MERSEASGASTITSGICVDESMPCAWVEGQEVWLTRREWQLLGALVDAGGATVTRERLYRAVWGHSLRSDDRSVDVFVHRLRARLAAVAPEFDWIHTHSQVGYRLAPEPVEQEHTR